MTVDDYLELLDWSARQCLPGKRGFTNAHVPPILERLGFEPDSWLQLVENFDDWYRSAAGSVERLREEAQRLGRRWLAGVGAPAYG